MSTNGSLPLSSLIVWLTRTGQTGLGKSTLVNTLFASHLVDSKGRTEPDISARATTEIHAKSQGEFPRTRRSERHASWLLLIAVIIENGVRLKLNIIDTPGYGDLINNEGCWDPIVKYVSLASSSALTLDQGPALGLPPQGAYGHA